MIKWQAMLLRFIVLSANQNDHLSDFPEQSRAPQKGCNGVLRRFFISQETYGLIICRIFI